MADHKQIEKFEIENPYGVPIFDGEVLCPKCKGSSYIQKWRYCNKGSSYIQKWRYCNKGSSYIQKWRYCNRCWGDGKLDWIELIVGKPEPYYESSSSSLSYTKQRSKKNEKEIFLNGSNNQFRF